MRSHTFETPGHVRLEVEVESGSVDVTTGVTPVTDVTVTSDAESSELVERATIEERATGQTHVVRIKLSKGRWGIFRGGESVRISVVVPPGTDLSVQTASADVDATGRFGRVEMETASGSITVDEGIDVRLRAASGDISLGAGETVDLRSVSGDVVVGHAVRSARLSASSGSVRLGTVSGPAKIETVSGSIDVDLAEEGLRTKTVSGTVDIRCVASGEVSLGSVSGDARVGIPPGRDLEIDAQSLSGHLTSDFDLDGAPSWNAGSQRVVVKSNSVSGELRIVRAAPPATRSSEPAGAGPDWDGPDGDGPDGGEPADVAPLAGDGPAGDEPAYDPAAGTAGDHAPDAPAAGAGGPAAVSA